MKKFFITATGTDIGKTYVTSLLCRQLRERGLSVRALKPVISGFAPNQVHGDCAQLLAGCGLPQTMKQAEAISPWRFVAPLSPDMAARREGRVLVLDDIVAFCSEQDDCDVLLAEGVGGVMVPLNADETTLDWMEALDWPVLLVTGSYLGTLSHTLTSLAVLRARGLACAGVIVSESAGSSVPLAETAETLRRFLPAGCGLALLPRLESSPTLWHNLPDLTHLLDI